jgi:predicted RNA-binding protein with RPS1 domain
MQVRSSFVEVMNHIINVNQVVVVTRIAKGESNNWNLSIKLTNGETINYENRPQKEIDTYYEIFSNLTK